MLFACCAPSENPKIEALHEADKACAKYTDAFNSSRSITEKTPPYEETPALSDDEKANKYIVMKISLSPRDPIFRCYDGFIAKNRYKIRAIAVGSYDGVVE